MGSSPKECFIDKLPIIHFKEKINFSYYSCILLSHHTLSLILTLKKKTPNAVLPMAQHGVQSTKESEVTRRHQLTREHTTVYQSGL